MSQLVSVLDMTAPTPEWDNVIILAEGGGDYDDLGDALAAVAVAGDGTALVVMAGTYTEAGALTVANNQIRIVAVGDVTFVSTLAAGFINVTGDDFVIEGVTLTTNQNGTLLYFDGALNGLVRNCRFERTGGVPFGVNTDNISTVRVESCSFGPGTWNALLYHHGSTAATYLDAVDISCDPATRFVYALWGTVFGRLSLNGFTQTFTNRDDFAINSSANGCHLILDDVHVSGVDTGITQGLADSPITLRDTTILDATEPLDLTATAVLTGYNSTFPLAGSTVLAGAVVTWWGNNFSSVAGVTSNTPGTLATDDFVFGSGQLTDDADATHDARMFFDKSKYAFAAGRAQTTEWDSIGYGTAAFGNNCVASGSYALVAGLSCDVTGSYSFAWGFESKATQQYSSAAGYQAETRAWGEHAMSSGRFAVDGDAQGSSCVWRNQTTDATAAVELFLNGSSLRYPIPLDYTVAFSILLVARRTDADDESAAYKFEGVLDNNAGTTALVGAVTKTVLSEDSGAWDADVVADDANDSLKIQVTGEVGKTIRWVATGHMSVVGG